MAGFFGRLWQRVTGASDWPAEYPTEGWIGAKLEAVRKTHDFFRFFHFESIGVEERDDGSGPVLAFKPRGPDFRDLVTLHCWTTPSGLIRTIRLSVMRSFIDSPRTCVHAADLYNSFLRSVGEVRSGDAIDAFANEITVRSMARSGMPVIMRGPAPVAAGEPSRAYGAYAGELEAENLVYGSVRLKLVARNGRESRDFEILVWPTDEEERERARKERPPGA